MKKFLFLAVAAIGLLATSCSKDETTNALPEGDAKVTFTVVAPELQTRTIGDGTTATTLEYSVYDAAWNHIAYLDGTTTINLQTNVELELIDGKTYNLIFWAENAAAPYTFDRANKKVTINYNAIKANHEEHDAFYQIVENLTVKAGLQETVKLYRPFAQLNIATSDWSTIENSNEVFTQTEVKVKAYNTLNLVDGEVSGGEVRTFNFEAMPTETLNVNNVNYKWLAMNYLLVNEKELVEVTFNANNANVAEKVWYNVPVERNHRTHILGKLLTSPVDFEVIIMPGFDEPGYEVDGDTGELTMSVATAQELQEAIYAATGNATIKFEQDIDANATRSAAVTIIVPQKEGVNLTIDGCDFKFDGTFEIHGAARFNKPETLTFKNINFEHADGSIDFISGNSTESAKRYAHNVTIEDCTFTGNANGDVVGMRLRQSYNILVKNVEATNVHSLIWATGVTGLEFDGVKSEGKNGISTGTTAEFSVKNSDIVATDGYGVRADGSVVLNMLFADNTIEAKQPIIVRKATMDATLNLEGVNTLTTTEKYQIVFTAGDDSEEYTTPTGKINVEGNKDGISIFKGVEQAILDEIFALEAGEEYTLTLDEDLNVTGNENTNPYIQVNAGDVTIEGNGNEITTGSASNYGFIANGEDASITINNAEITSNGGAIGAVNGAEVVFNSGSAYVDTASTSGRYIFYLEGEGSTITINDGTFSWDPADNQKRAYVYAGAGTFVYINGGTFGKASTRSGYTDGIMGSGTVEITGGTFGFDPSKWVAEGYKAVKTNNVWVVEIDGAEVENTTPEENTVNINNTLAEGGMVLFEEDITATDSASNSYGSTGINQINGGIINGNGNTLSVPGASGTWDSAINTTGGTIKNLTIDAGFRGIFVNHNSTNCSKVYLDNVIIDGPVYTISCDQGTNNGLEAKNSTFKGWTSYAKTIGDVLFTNCKFGEGAGYAFCRPYAPTTFVNCDFEAGYILDSRVAVKFVNCRFDGVQITNENVGTLVTNVNNVTIE